MDPSSNQMPFYCKDLPAPHPTSCIHYGNKKSLYLDAQTKKALHLVEAGHVSQQLHSLGPSGQFVGKVNAHSLLTKWDTVKFQHKIHGQSVFSFLNKEDLLTSPGYFNIYVLLVGGW